MALRIRLARYGAKKRPFYRIVVSNSEAPRDGRFLDIIGTYDPRQEPVIRKNTPQECFDATHWNDEVDGVYANQSETQEKISMFIIGLAIVLNFLVCLVALGKLK